MSFSHRSVSLSLVSEWQLAHYMTSLDSLCVLQVLPDSICWQLHDLLYHGEQPTATFEGPLITGGTGLDEETDDE